MRTVAEWIAAEAERRFPGTSETAGPFGAVRITHAGTDKVEATQRLSIENLPTHQFGACSKAGEDCGEASAIPEEATGAEGFSSLLDAVQTMPDGALPEEELEKFEAEERERRIYRGRTVEMLRRYLRYSIETGRLPSVLGQEFFRAKVTTYTVVTFEDRVIFVHDMERCLEQLDEFSRQLIARRVLQEHDRWAAARLLHCNEKTVRRLTPVALDLLSEILLDRGLLERIEQVEKKSCQGGLEGENFVSACEESENNF